VKWLSDKLCENQTKYIQHAPCYDKDCLEDLRVYSTRQSQEIIDRAINVKCRRAEVLWTYIDVEDLPFNRGFYAVDVKYFYRVVCDAFTGVGKPTEVVGLATFDKRVLLFGSEGNAKIFSSRTALNPDDEQIMRSTNMPVAVCELVDPIALSAKLVEACNYPAQGFGSSELVEVPEGICNCFDDELVLDGGIKRVYVSLGQFSIIRLERDTQLIIPSYDFCLPEKECPGSSDDSPCDLFSRIEFPVDEFFPPSEFHHEEYRDTQFSTRR